MGVIKGDTRSLDYSLYELESKFYRSYERSDGNDEPWFQSAFELGVKGARTHAHRLNVTLLDRQRSKTRP